MLNDPNGLVYAHGQVYAFFQWNRFAKNHSHKEWGYFTTTDYLHWKFLGSALLPDQDYDRDGVYSGCGLEMDHEVYLYYTGNNKQNGIRRSTQCLATTMDGKTFLKQGPILATPKEYTEHFRDPKVIRMGNQYWMVIGAQTKQGTGAVALCDSLDGRTWYHRHVLTYCDAYEMIECPDLFILADQAVLLLCPQKRDNETDVCLSSFSGYQVGTFDQTTGKFMSMHQTPIKLDEGFDFYAPQTFLDETGRRILLAWMSNMSDPEEQMFATLSSSLHCFTIPRTLELKNNQLLQHPIQELYQLIKEPLTQHETDSEISISYQKAAYVKIRQITKSLTFMFFEGNYQLQYDEKQNEVLMRRKHCVSGCMEEKRISIQLHTIEAWIDTSSVELFLNDGAISITARVFPTQTQRILIKKQNKIKVQANALYGFHIA